MVHMIVGECTFFKQTPHTSQVGFSLTYITIFEILSVYCITNLRMISSHKMKISFITWAKSKVNGKLNLISKHNILISWSNFCCKNFQIPKEEICFKIEFAEHWNVF